MAYTAMYSTTDIFNLILDFLGSIVAAMVSNATILVSLVILGIVVYLFRGIISGVFGAVFDLIRTKR